MRKELVIFDLDGTLVDAYPAIIKSFNFTMKQLGMPKVRSGMIRKSVGWGDSLLLKPFVSDEFFSRAVTIYRRHHAKTLKDNVKMMPYARDLLVSLKARKLKLAIASNRPTRFTGIILKALGIRSFFDMVLCADKLKAGKPDPLILNKLLRSLRVGRKLSVYVGDMALDVETGKRARIDTIAVATGSSSIVELRESGPTRLCRNLRCLKNDSLLSH